MTKYQVGDYVRVKDLSRYNEDNGVAPMMKEYSGKLVRITHITYEGFYLIEDNDYFWWDDLFEYRLGNYEDNNFNHKSDVNCIVGFTYHGIPQTFEGVLDNFAPNGLSSWHDKNGRILSLPYDMINYIIPN